MAQSDEECVRSLLEAHLREKADKDACCERVKNDPPDIICRVANERWGIEVTRVGQREVQNGVEKSRGEIDNPLVKFGVALGKTVGPLRKLAYRLHLKGLPSGMRWSSWKKQVQQEVEQIVTSERHAPMFPGEWRSFVGGSMECLGSRGAFDHGDDWPVVGLRDNTSAPGGHMTSDISANVEVMLRCALNDKCLKLEALSGFDRIGLVLLNTYPFANDTDEVASILDTIISEDHQYSVFDVVFCHTGGSMHAVYDKHAGPISG